MNKNFFSKTDTINSLINSVNALLVIYFINNKYDNQKTL